MNWENSFIEIAKIVASHSTCIRVKVGSIIVKDRRIISMGHNGALPGKIHCEDLYSDWKELYTEEAFYEIHGSFSRISESHAEQNAIAYAARNGIPTLGSTMYSTHSPCKDCAKLIVSAGIKNLVYFKLYDREPEGIAILEDNNVKCLCHIVNTSYNQHSDVVISS